MPVDILPIFISSRRLFYVRRHRPEDDIRFYFDAFRRIECRSNIYLQMANKHISFLIRSYSLRTKEFRLLFSRPPGRRFYSLLN